MSDIIWIALIFAVVVVVGIIVLRSRLGSATIEVPGAKASLQAHVPKVGPTRGARMTGVKAGGSAHNIDHTGQGAAMSDLEAKGNAVNVTHPAAGVERPK